MPAVTPSYVAAWFRVTPLGIGRPFTQPSCTPKGGQVAGASHTYWFNPHSFVSVIYGSCIMFYRGTKGFSERGTKTAFRWFRRALERKLDRPLSYRDAMKAWVDTGKTADYNPRPVSVI